MNPTTPEAAIAAVLPAALELTTAYTAASDDPSLYWQTMRRVLGESMDGADPATAMAQLIFGLSALSGILLDDLAEHTGQDRAALLAEIHRAYLTG
ncbi:hypothetical protein GCM10022251_57300 [Phytohabitans flavus]|uniref:Uncharacterized protein n=1 Tax=Phytohabitans flavus TaxID=1076124 RepID=A0A6F8XTV4_9ACTN|nr:hypothetical protein [Phytohabitans flavus]BCB77181.1 hypothetical protein Pflav_035910 [Phytohabitans flavus]